MANETLFNSMIGKFIPLADAVNEAGGAAYRLAPRAALVQYAATGCLNSTFYASANDQLQMVLNLCAHPDVAPEFIARMPGGTTFETVESRQENSSAQPFSLS